MFQNYPCKHENYDELLSLPVVVNVPDEWVENGVDVLG